MYLLFKRGFDYVFSFMAILILMPLFLLVILMIKIDSRGPIFFRQKRVGKNKKYFSIIKFRTMYIETPKEMPTHLLHKPDLFITKVGRFLRKTSLDELPQLINILRGEMSLVGPRPALWNQYDLIAERDRYGANQILPGLTGWAQVNGRDELPITVKSELDGEYAEKMSFTLDIKIILKTTLKVVKSEGVQEGISQSSEKESI